MLLISTSGANLLVGAMFWLIQRDAGSCVLCHSQGDTSNALTLAFNREKQLTILSHC